jgi:hypothetical protein
LWREDKEQVPREFFEKYKDELFYYFSKMVKITKEFAVNIGILKLN